LSQTDPDGPRLDQESIDILAACAASTRRHSQFFFPEIFFSAYSILHRQIVEALDSGHKKIVIAAPRGLGKTSTVLFGVASRKILFQLARFIIYLTNSGDNAVLQTENLKHELLANERVRHLFGSIKIKADDSLDERFSKKSWVTSGGVFVLPRGAGQQVRGLLYHSKRPDLILIDDLEDKMLIESDLQRSKLKEWFYSDVMKCGDQYGKTTQFVYIDTLKHEDSLLQELLDSPEWHSVHLSICDDNYHSHAPDFMSDEEIRAEVEELKRKGKLDVFYREMRNIPVASETASFKPEFFRRYVQAGDKLIWKEHKETVKASKKDLVNVVIVDPAKEVQIQNADTGIVGVGVSRDDKRIFFQEEDSGKMMPDEIFKRSFAMARRINAYIIAVEVTSLHQFIVQPFENQKRMESWVGQFIWINARGKKEERIAHLAPYYRQGLILHNKYHADKLESQLTGFPRSKLWDVMDAFAYIIQIMDEYFIYFDSGDVMDDPDDEYEELEDERVLSYARII
jgi:hypothetical protein